MFAFTEAFAEPAGVAGGVAEDEPEDLGVGVDGCTFDGFPDDVGDGRGFVEDNEKAFAFVVEACECFGIGLGLGDHIDAPSAFASWVLGDEGGSV